MHPLGMALGIAYLTGGLVGHALAQRRGVPSRRWWWAVVAFMAATVVGARLWYVAADIDYFLQDPAQVWLPPIEGLSFVGGLAAGLVGLVVAARALPLSFWALADVLGVSYLAGSIVVGALWRSPVGLAVVDAGWSALLDGVYITALYFLLWSLHSQERIDRRVGAIALSVVVADLAFRLGLGSVAHWVEPAATTQSAAWTHAARILFMVVTTAFFVLRTLRSRPAGGYRPYHRPLRRWVVWFAVYGLLIVVFYAARV